LERQGSVSMRSGTRGDKRRSIARKQRAKKLPTSPLILIVCEGVKTEPGYFEALRKSKKFQPDKIRVLTSKDCGGTDPGTLVCSAREWKDKLRQEEGLDYDEVWCVFDRDSHPNFDTAVNKARANKMKLGVSVPCFELWYLLHFKKQTAHIERGALRQQLKKKKGFENYDKEGLYDKLKGRQAKAIENAKALAAYNKAHGLPDTNNPSTHVHLLVERLENMK
jgi:hypothetical protein